MTARAESWEMLEWDSGVFGFAVARIGEIEDRETLKAAIGSARRNDVRLAYLQTDDSRVARDAETLGGLLVSERVTFARSVSRDWNPRVRSANSALKVETWRGTTPTPEMIQLARDAGRYSRFRLDPKIPTKVFEKIYDAWIINSLNGKIADEVMVTLDGSTVSGLVTVGRKNGRADIGLLAVCARSRGRGLGKALVEASLDWAVRHDISDAQVVTQGANVGACRLYESCGYTIERSEHVFHFWS